MRRAFPSLLVAIVITAGLTLVGQAQGTKSRCAYLHEQTGCVLQNNPEYFGQSGGSRVKISLGYQGSKKFIVVSVYGPCFFDNYYDYQKLRVGMTIKVHGSGGEGAPNATTSASFKVDSAKKATGNVTQDLPANGANAACHKEATLVLKRGH